MVGHNNPEHLKKLIHMAGHNNPEHLKKKRVIKTVQKPSELVSKGSKQIVCDHIMVA